MYITWYGQSCFKIQAKSLFQEVVLICDPFEPKIGLKLPKIKADIVTISHAHFDHNFLGKIEGRNLNEKPFVIAGPGEYEIKNTLIYGIPSWHDNEQGSKRGENTIYLIETEGISLAHLGDLGQKELSQTQLEQLEKVDVLMIPVGGVYTIDAKQATVIISQIEPRIVIPMHYKIQGLNIKLETIDKFLKEIGAKKEEVGKLKITKKDLPQEETKVVVLKV